MIEVGHFLLVADDNPGDRDLLRLGFEECGILLDMHEVADGEQAIRTLTDAERVPSSQPCAVILDINMPRSSGLEVLAWMRSRPTYCCTPVWVMSSSQRPTDVVRARELGATHVAKPTDAAQLLATVERIGRELIDRCN